MPQNHHEVKTTDILNQGVLISRNNCNSTDSSNLRAVQYGASPKTPEISKLVSDTPPMDCNIFDVDYSHISVLAHRRKQEDHTNAPLLKRIKYSHMKLRTECLVENPSRNTPHLYSNLLKNGCTGNKRAET